MNYLDFISLLIGFVLLILLLYWIWRPSIPQETKFCCKATSNQISLRDEIAMAALTSLVHDSRWSCEDASALAYRYADAMLKSRSEKNKV